MPAHRVEIPREVREAVIAAHRARVPVREIADRHFGGSLSRAQSYLHRLRHKEGVDLPSRYPARDGEVPAATTPQRPAFDLTGYCAKGRTLEEICKRAGWTPEEAKAQLVEREGYDLFRQRNRYGEQVYLYLPKPSDALVVKPRCWTHRRQPDGQPYLWVEFGDPEWDKIKLVPIGDVHYGAVGHDAERFREWLNWIASRDDVFVFFLGDLIDNALDPAKGGFEQNVRAGHPQINAFCSLIAPIAHKVLWATVGNHEHRSVRAANIDPTWVICERLGIPYFAEPVYVDVLAWGHRFTFFTFHGTTCAQTKGGKANAASRPTQWQEWTHFTVSGHSHDKITEEEGKLIRDPVNFRLDYRKTYTVVAGSFLRYYGTYASQKVYRPGVVGTVSIDLYREDGDYHASS